MTVLLHTATYGNPKKPPLVMLHGFMGSGDSFMPVIPFLEKKFFVITMDLPGHGQSLFSAMPNPDRPKDFIQATQMVLYTLKALGLKSFSVYGYSMGGRVAQQACILAPSRINHLILESASLGIQNQEERKARQQRDNALLDSITTPEDFRRFLVKWHRLPLFCTLEESPLLPSLMESKQKNNVEELRHALKILGVGNHDYWTPVLAGLTVPITFLHGELDAKYKNEAAKASEIIARMQVLSFPLASHNVHIQFPQKVAETTIRAVGAP